MEADDEGTRIYESMYGNTAAVASAIADGVARSGGGSRQTRHRGPAGPGGGGDLLVVGGPTHAHGMSRPSTRKTAAADKENVFPQPTVTPGLRDWIAELPGGNGRLAAAFDTRIDKPVLLTGSARRASGGGSSAEGIASSSIPSASSCRRTTACSTARSNTPCGGGAWPQRLPP